MPKAPDYETDVLLNVASYVESADDLPDDMLVECGLRQFGVPWSSRAVLGHEASRTERRALLLTLRKLADRGDVELVSGGVTGRLTHLRPTLEGLLLAVARSDGQANPSVISRALQRTRWGRRLAKSLDSEPTAGSPPAEPTSLPSSKKDSSR